MLNSLGLDPSVLQLLFSQLGLNPSQAEALGNSDYTRLVGERLASDPDLAANPLLGLLMNGLSGASAGSDETSDDAEDWDAAGVDPDDTSHAATRATRRSTGVVIDAHAEPVIDDPEDASDGAEALVALREVAAILGACACWGQDPACPDCDGLGEPGYRPSRDPDLFIRWIRPTLRRMRLRLVGPRRAPCTTTTTTTKPEE